MSRSIKEILKTILLIILVIISIWLVFALWPNSADNFVFSDLFKFGEEQETSIDVTSIIEPEDARYRVKNGNEYVIADRDEVFAAVNNEIQSFCSKTETMMNEESEYSIDAAKEANYLVLRLPILVPFSEYCQYAKVKEGSNFDKLQNFDEIIVSESNLRKIYIINKSENKFYSIESEYEFSSLGSLLENAEFENTRLVKTKDIMGEGEKTFIPFATNETLKTISVYSAKLSQENEERLARAIFDNTFDFARRAVDANGNITYMYGYGQKVLNIYTNGRIEYRAEASTRTREGLLYDMSVGVEFLKKVGAFESDGHVSYYLASVSRESTDRSNITRLEYASMHDGRKLITDSEKSIVVEIENGQVVYYQKDLEQVQVYDAQIRSKEIATILAEKCIEINTISNNLSEAKAEASYTYVCNNIERITNIYYEKPGQGYSSCWLLELKNGKEFAFDYLSGEMLYSK